jgi:hypothetical protein
MGERVKVRHAIHIETAVTECDARSYHKVMNGLGRDVERAQHRDLYDLLVQ